MNQAALISWLEQSFADRRLDGDEKLDLRAFADDMKPDLKRFARNRAFEMVRDVVARGESPATSAVLWLEQVVKTLEAVDALQARSEAHFSPGNACRGAILDCLHQSRTSVDICVFTLADDRITDAVLKAHSRGIAVRLISDDDKSQDEGSDVIFLRKQGVAVRMDSSPSHMHHKFALFDGNLLLNGSFNWTRSASDNNQENIVLTTDGGLVNTFTDHFEELWERFA